MTKTEAYHYKRGHKPIAHRDCAVCGTNFALFNDMEVSRRRCCSVGCQRKHHGLLLKERCATGTFTPPDKSGKPYKMRETRICARGGCGKTFEVIYHSRSATKYCCKECAYESVIRGRFIGENSGKWVEKVKLSCKACGNPYEVIPSQAEGSKACSRECADKLMERRVVLKCEWCGENYETRACKEGKQKYCSRGCTHAAMPICNTSIERKIEAILKTLPEAADYEKSYTFHRFAIDFAIPSHKLFIECDGTYWHSLPNAIERDAIKDRLAAEAGWTMLRLSEDDINNSLALCEYRIQEALGIHSDQTSVVPNAPSSPNAAPRSLEPITLTL